MNSDVSILLVSEVKVDAEEVRQERDKDLINMLDVNELKGL